MLLSALNEVAECCIPNIEQTAAGGGHVVGRTTVKTQSILCTSNEKLVTALALLILALASHFKAKEKDKKCEKASVK